MRSRSCPARTPDAPAIPRPTSTRVNRLADESGVTRTGAAKSRPSSNRASGRKRSGQRPGVRVDRIVRHEDRGGAPLPHDLEPRFGSTEEPPRDGAPVLEIAGAAAALRSLPRLQLAYDLGVDADARREREPASVDPADGDSSLPRAERAGQDVRAAGGHNAQSDAAPHAVERLVEHAVAAEHPDLVAHGHARELGRVPAALRAERLLRPQPSLDLRDPLVRDAARVGVDDERAARQMTKASGRASFRSKRSRANGERSSVGVRPATSSATCSPTAGACWKPWPEKPVA